MTLLARTNTSRKQGGLGKMDIPLLSDINKQISTDYGVLLEDQGISLRLETNMWMYTCCICSCLVTDEKVDLTDNI